MEKMECRDILIMIMGLPGSGKTYLARLLSRHLEATHLNSDILRRNLNLRGKYSRADKERVYHEMLDQTKSLLQSGKCVVVDATFYKQELRAAYEKIAEEAGVGICRIMAVADEENIRKRVSKDRPDSEADFEVYKEIRDAFEEVESQFLTVHTDRSGDAEMVDQVMQYIANIDDTRSR